MKYSVRVVIPVVRNIRPSAESGAAPNAEIADTRLVKRVRNFLMQLIGHSGAPSPLLSKVDLALRAARALVIGHWALVIGHSVPLPRDGHAVVAQPDRASVF